VKRQVLATLFATLLVLCGGASAQKGGGLKFSLTDLQYYMPGSTTSSAANAINASGSVTGILSDGTNQDCFLYIPPTRLLRATLKSFSSSTTPRSCDAAGIDSGADVGGSMLMSKGLTNAFLRQSNGVITTFPSQFGSFNTFGDGIDDFKEVVGTMYGPDDGDGNVYSATRWSANGTAVTLDADPNSWAAATSSTGALVAIGHDQPPSWIWPYGPTLQDPYWIGDYPLAVNANSHAAGVLWVADSTNWFPHAALWLDGGAVTDLGSPNHNSSGNSISSDDWVVGNTDAWDAAGDGFLKISSPQCPAVINLNTLLDSSGSGWTVIAANGINSAHQIVGQAKNSGGQLHAVLLTPDNNLLPCK